jgi:hypothetical protein
MDEHVLADGIGLNKSIALRRIEPLHRISKDWQNLNHVGTYRRFRPLEHLGSADVDHAAEQRMYLFEKCRGSGVIRGLFIIRNESLGLGLNPHSFVWS